MSAVFSTVQCKNVNGNQIYYDKSGNEIFRIDGTNRLITTASNRPLVHNLRQRFTIAEINTGATLMPAITGYKYRLQDVTLVAIGGNAGTATAVTLSGTQSASVVALITAAVAALTRSTVVKPDTANVTVLADGASFVACDVSTALTIEKTGGSLATATHVDVILSVAIEPA